jgi:hypothetical protein
MIPQGHFYYRGSWIETQSWFWMKNLEIVAIYLTLPILATSFALRFKNLFLASALTWVALLLPPSALTCLALLLPPSAGLILFRPLGQAATLNFALFAIVGGNIFPAGLVLWQLRQKLQRRDYSF